MTTLELDEKTAKMLTEDRKISDALDKRKSDLVIEKKELIEKQNMIMIRLMEIGTELEEYKEEY